MTCAIARDHASGESVLVRTLPISRQDLTGSGITSESPVIHAGFAKARNLSRVHQILGIKCFVLSM